MESIASFQRLYETDFKFCVVCQKGSKEKLILPKSKLSYEKLLSFIQERAELNDDLFKDIYKRTIKLNVDILEENRAKYHKSCYSRICIKSYIKALKSEKPPKNESLCGDASTSGTSAWTKSTRSKTSTFSKLNCVFCDKKGVLHRVATQDAGEL